MVFFKRFSVCCCVLVMKFIIIESGIDTGIKYCFKFVKVSGVEEL